MSSFRSRVVFALLLSCLWGCEPSQLPAGPPTGTVQLAVTLPEGLTPSDVAYVTLTISAPDMSAFTTKLVSSEGTWGGVFGELQAGAHRTFLIQAYDDSTVRYQGSAEDVTITAGTTGLVAVTLKSVSTPPFTNAAPILDTLKANPLAVVMGSGVSLLARTHDPDPGDSVSYAWSAPAGGFTAPTQPSTTWMAMTDPGLVPLQLQVSDSRGAAFTVSIGVQVLEGPSPHWSSTGTPSRQRLHHQLTPLSTGQVLASGGVGEASAELYDQATGTWSLTGAMASPREGHTATLLPDGRVLVAGGVFSSGAGSHAEAEVYDPATGTWSPTGAMLSPRDQHTATLLPDGRVLVTGGHGATGEAVATAEVYDPSTGTWSPTDPMTSVRVGHLAVWLPTVSRVLVLGGLDNSHSLATAEVYDPSTGTWSRTSDLRSPRALSTATLLPNGMVLVAGGSDPEAQKTAEVYEPAWRGWHNTGPMASAHWQHTATLLPSGGVLVAGGTQVGDAYRAPTEVFNPFSASWSRVGSTRQLRVSHAAAALPNGQVLISGGESPSSEPTPDELYTP